MKSKRVIIISTIIFLVILFVFGGIKLKEITQEKNVFDEMYYTELSDLNNSEAKGFPKMKQIKEWERKNPDIDNVVGPIVERYKDNQLEKNEQLSIGFNFSKKTLSISYAKEINTKLLYRIDYSYSIEDHLLKEDVMFFDENRENFEVTDKEEVEKYLDKYQVSKDFLKKKEKEILYDIVLTDWFANYDSKFSMNDLGKIKIEKDKFLK